MSGLTTLFAKRAERVRHQRSHGNLNTCFYTSYTNETLQNTTMAEVLITDAHYDEFLAEVMALPPKKRKHYKSRLLDKHGQLTKVIYRDGQLMNYSIPMKQFVPMRAHRHFSPGGLVSDSQIGQLVINRPELQHDVVHACVEFNSTGNHNPNRNRVKIPPPASN